MSPSDAGGRPPDFGFDLYPPPGSPSWPPAWSDIERLALHYPVLHQAVTLVQRGDVTQEQALILAVFAIAQAFQQLFQKEVERLRSEPHTPVFVRGNEP